MQLNADLHWKRGSFELDVKLDFPLTGITALFGPSGSGKTSFLRALAGLERAGGTLEVGGTHWQSAGQFLPPHRRRIGYIFQEADFFAHLNVEKNLLYGYSRCPQAERRFTLAEVADLLKMRHLLTRSTVNLSGGERQLVSLGRALLSSPRFLLMDEPLAALDQPARSAIYPFLEHIATTMRIPILYVSHALDEVARLADQMILMAMGKITATGKIHDMLARLDLPLAQSPDAEVVIRGSVLSHDDAWQLSTIEFGGGKFLIPQSAAQAGENVRLRVAASDVSISLSHQADTSIVNIFPAEVVEIAEQGAIMLLKLDLSGVPVLARVTRLSCHGLGIKPGARVFAQIKGAAVLA